MSAERDTLPQSLVLKLMTVIVDEKDEDRVMQFLRERLVRFQYNIAADGTANSELQALLGFTGSHKILSVSLLPDFHAEEMMRVMPDQLELHKKGKGIAFTIPLSGICNPLLHTFNEEVVEKLINLLPPSTASKIKEINSPMDSETEKINHEIIRYELIIIIVNHGCSEEVMNTAKAHGAGGGTIINARRTGLEEAATFLGLPVQKQKEIIFILAEQKDKAAIMKAINHEYGLNTPARGIIFSLPVDSAAGLHSIS